MSSQRHAPPQPLPAPPALRAQPAPSSVAAQRLRLALQRAYLQGLRWGIGIGLSVGVCTLALGAALYSVVATAVWGPTC